MNFSIFFLLTNSLLIEYNTSFFYQRKNCKKHGHFKKKTNRITNISTYELRIEKEDNSASKIFTYVHELTHMINHHLDDKSITYAEKECVAHFVSLYYMDKYSLTGELKRSNLSKKWNVDDYHLAWLKNKKIKDSHKIIMKDQYMHTINKINFYIDGGVLDENNIRRV